MTIVTPSFNQGQFLEQTIVSVLGQDYPNLEYIVLDGGSSDDSVAIIKKYEHRLSYWRSAPDGGQSQAINEGFRRATGEIIGWINSDDYYLPGALSRVASLLPAAESAILHGNCISIREDTSFSFSSDVSLISHDVLDYVDMISQPSSFYTKRALESVGELDESLNFVMDWDWFIRASRKTVQFLTVTQPLSVYRLHEGHKSGTGSQRRLDEIKSIYERYNGARGLRLFEGTEGMFFRRLFRYAISRSRETFGSPRLERMVLAMGYPFLSCQYKPAEIRSALYAR